jgi:hypothetical protein
VYNLLQICVAGVLECVCDKGYVLDVGLLICTRCKLFPMQTTMSIGTPCTCAPGFFNPYIANLNRFALYNLTTVDPHQHPLSIMHRQMLAMYLDEFPLLKTHNIASKTSSSELNCILCPPGFYCIGGNSMIQMNEINQSSYTYYPVGAYTAKSWVRCPVELSFDKYIESNMRMTGAFGMGSCFQSAQTWQSTKSVINSDSQRYTFPGILYVNMSENRNNSILSSILRRDIDLMQTVLFIDTSKDISIRYVEDIPTGHNFYIILFEINVIKVVRASIYDLHSIQETYKNVIERIDMGTGAAYNVIIQATWALLVNSALQKKHNVEAVIVVPSLVNNPTVQRSTTNIISFLTQRSAYKTTPRFVFVFDFKQVFLICLEIA